MDKIEIDLTLQFNIPQNWLTVNSLLFGVRKNMPKIFFTILRAIFTTIAERTIQNLKSSVPGRFVKNGHQSNFRQFRTSFGVFRYQLAQIYDKVNNRIYAPLLETLSVVPYHRCMKESCESGIVALLSICPIEMLQRRLKG